MHNCNLPNASLRGLNSVATGPFIHFDWRVVNRENWGYLFAIHRRNTLIREERGCPMENLKWPAKTSKRI